MPQESMRTALDFQGFANLAAVHHSLPTSEEAMRGCEGRLAHQGPLVVRTGHHTGRAPKDRFAVREPSSEEKVCGVLPTNRSRPIASRLSAMVAYLQGKGLFVQDCLHFDRRLVLIGGTVYAGGSEKSAFTFSRVAVTIFTLCLFACATTSQDETGSHLTFLSELATKARANYSWCIRHAWHGFTVVLTED